MDTEQASADDRIDQLLREIRRRDIVFIVIHLLPWLGLLASVAWWYIGLRPEWAAVAFWIVQGPLILYLAILIILGIGRPRFVRDFVFGPERELSAEEKAERAKRDEVQRHFDKLTRPISWTMCIAGYGTLMNILLWWNGQLTMTVELGIATGLLGVIAGLSVWALRRIHTAYFRNPM